MEPCIQDRAVAVLQEQMKVANNRIADLEAIHTILVEMNRNIGTLTEKVTNVAANVEQHDKDLTAIKETPGREMVQIKMAIVICVVLYAVNLLLGK